MLPDWFWRHRTIPRPRSHPEGIKGILVAIGSIIAAIVCALVAG